MEGGEGAVHCGLQEAPPGRTAQEEFAQPPRTLISCHRWPVGLIRLLRARWAAEVHDAGLGVDSPAALRTGAGSEASVPTGTSHQLARKSPRAFGTEQMKYQ